MGPTVGIFFDRASAERAVGNLKAGGLSPKSIHVLVPDSEPLVAKMPMSEAEQPGMGKAIGGVIGGAVGVASGAFFDGAGLAVERLGRVALVRSIGGAADQACDCKQANDSRNPWHIGLSHLSARDV